MKETTKENIKFLLIIIIIISIIVCGIVALISYRNSLITTETYDIYSTDAPEGYYWIEKDASGFIILFNYNEKLTETYTIKYLDDTPNGKELKTVRFDSSDRDLHVILLDTNESMYLEITGIKHSEYNEHTLYIPNPQLYNKNKP